MYRNALLMLLIGLPLLSPAQDAKETYFVISMESDQAVFFTLLTANANITGNQSFEDWFWDDFEKRNQDRDPYKIEAVYVKGPFAHKKDADLELNELLDFEKEKAQILNTSVAFYVEHAYFTDRSATASKSSR